MEPFSLEYQIAAGSLTLRLPENSAAYYQLDYSTDLFHFSPHSMQLGRRTPAWEIDLGLFNAPVFFRARRLSVYSPGDSDSDGLDDIWELDNGLDPLNPADALEDPDGNQLTRLQEYWLLFGRRISREESISREVTLFNFGAPTDIIEAISREVSLWNFGAPPAPIEAVSRELSLFNGERPSHPLIHDAISREISVWNWEVPPARIEAISQELSLYNGERASDAMLPDAISRKLSIFNADAPTVVYEAISRELSLYNNLAGAGE